MIGPEIGIKSVGRSIEVEAARQPGQHFKDNQFMKSARPLTMSMLVLTLLAILLAGPFADRSLAQTKTPTPKPPTPTKTATPFLSHPISPDQLLYTPSPLSPASNLKHL